MKERTRSRRWLIFIAVALFFHLVLFVYVKPRYLSFLLPAGRTSGQGQPGGGAPPDAILYIPVELDEPSQEEALTRLVQEPAAEEPAKPSDTGGQPGSGGEPEGMAGLGDMVGNASRPLPPAPEGDLVRIPPRPLQITWPDTKRLKICLGHQIGVRVQVDEDGRILRVEPSPSASPPECVRAAVECATQIVFAPGKINGRSAKMWTEIRIDFREKP
jgi:hypothetical protein